MRHEDHRERIHATRSYIYGDGRVLATPVHPRGACRDDRKPFGSDSSDSEYEH